MQNPGSYKAGADEDAFELACDQAYEELEEISPLEIIGLLKQAKLNLGYRPGKTDADKAMGALENALNLASEVLVRSGVIVPENDGDNQWAD